uniref:RIIa domain-containing protein n=1 Tax=Glossina brevipalpis TaxID=37001 RepID=A0A1A9WT70_9MUSC
MPNENKRIQVPDELREVLLEFSISFLLEQPADVVDFAVDYFTKLQAARKIAPAAHDGGGEEAKGSSVEEEDEEEEGQAVFRQILTDNTNVGIQAPPIDTEEYAPQRHPCTRSVRQANQTANNDLINLLMKEFEKFLCIK